MKKLFILGLCLFSLSIFSQKKASALVYKKGKGYAKFYIPSEKDFIEGQEFFIKEKKLSIIGLRFFKTSTDTLSYYVNVDYVGEKTLLDKLYEEITPPHNLPIDFNKCTNNHQPSFTLSKSGLHIITIKRGNLVRSYKLNLELKSQSNLSKEDF